ncbi:MAG: hydrogenase nickel incorporation protein HypB [Deltaproteobacteria bacterium]|nr:hydrogenase nickel incorporation protein HypB [Deltaproteobacteria bacterium]MBW2072510.1 hydrogenase nickel incorporation protein HypB [Deltaproteobacteria bacterium]
MAVKVPVVRNILEANEQLAQENSRLFRQAGLFVVNLMSGPGAGKTSLLEHTIETLKDEIRIGVVEGDIQSSYDAERISQRGVQVVQLNTGGACHLDSSMIKSALNALQLAELDLLVIENVGNLVCPAEFKVGEDVKVMLLSVPEGDDKPLKYPLMFQEASVLLINKIDLLPYVDCDVSKIRQRALQLNSSLEILEISCRTGEGLSGWYNWLRSQVSNRKTDATGAEI